MTRRPRTAAERAAALARLQETGARLRAKIKPCPACGNQPAGPLHRTSRRLWDDRAERARANGGTDPVSGVTLADAEAHLTAMVPAGGSADG